MIATGPKNTGSAFAHFAGPAAILVGIVGFLYSASFVIVASNALPQLGLGPSWFLLFVGSLAAPVALIVVYMRVRDVDPPLALLSLVLGAGGALGAGIHAITEMALGLRPPPVLPEGLPSQIDPRGFATFGLAGLGLFGLSWLMRRSGQFPSGLATLGYGSAVLLELVFLGRLIILTPTNPLVLIPAGVEGFIVNPIWYIWLGRALMRTTPTG